MTQWINLFVAVAVAFSESFPSFASVRLLSLSKFDLYQLPYCHLVCQAMNASRCLWPPIEPICTIRTGRWSSLLDLAYYWPVDFVVLRNPNALAIRIVRCQTSIAFCPSQTMKSRMVSMHVFVWSALYNSLLRPNRYLECFRRRK